MRIAWRCSSSGEPILWFLRGGVWEASHPYPEIPILYFFSPAVSCDCTTARRTKLSFFLPGWYSFVGANYFIRVSQTDRQKTNFSLSHEFCKGFPCCYILGDLSFFIFFEEACFGERACFLYPPVPY